MSRLQSSHLTLNFNKFLLPDDLQLFPALKAQDLLVMTKNIQGFQISNEPWPFPMINNSARRRLTEDTWSKEQRNMQQEIADFFKSKGVSSAGQVSKLKKKTVVRKMDDLPPVSVTCTDPNSVTLPCPDEGLPKLCDKYNSEGKFSECFQKCKKSVSRTKPVRDKIKV